MNYNFKNADVVTFFDGYKILINLIGGVGDGFYTHLVTELNGNSPGFEIAYSGYSYDFMSSLIEKHGEVHDISNLVHMLTDKTHYCSE